MFDSYVRNDEGASAFDVNPQLNGSGAASDSGDPDNDAGSDRQENDAIGNAQLDPTDPPFDQNS